MTVQAAQEPETPSLEPVMGGNSTYRVEVSCRQTDGVAIGGRHLQAAHQLGIDALEACHTTRLFFLQGGLTLGDTKRLCRELLVDPVTEVVSVTVVDREASTSGAFPHLSADHSIDVTLQPGVTDPAGDNLVRAVHLLGIMSLERAATGQRHVLSGGLDEPALHALAVDVFSNPVIQRYAIDQPISPPFFSYQRDDETVESISVCDADDWTLRQISADRRLALTLDEMRAIRAYFRRVERDPTDVELEMLAQTWSEHCVHKTFKANVTYRGPAPGALSDAAPVEQHIDGILRSYIRAATERVDKPWLRSVFVDNAGIVAFDETYDLAFKVETHNHPSALEPFGGANTGIGGVVRDILGVSARPIANTDVLCFGPADMPAEDLPDGVLHPRRIADGVVHGVEDYGNKMGIPTVNGAIVYDDGYTANPLVYCGCLGILPRGSHPTEPQPGDHIVVVGGRTGRDGLRGATFSSMEMDQETSDVAGSAVQIGHPINEKQVLEALLRARDERLYTAITDCGAGGLSSAVGEMGAELGACVQLTDVPLKYPGLRPWEIWLSEAQERMVLSVPADNWPRLQEICAGQDVEAVCIGTFEDTGRLRLFYGDRCVGDVSMDFLHDGLPQRHMIAEWSPPADLQADGSTDLPTVDLKTILLALLAHPNIRSKEDVVRRYDHEVQGGTAVKPLTGVANHGPSDAAVLVPAETVASDAGTPMHKGVGLSVGICPQYSEFDPYAMAWAAIDEALRNIVAVGADPERVSILDNFCWGNPSLPDRLGALVRAAQGCYDAAVAYDVPFISGKDSLNNEYTGSDGERHAIPGTLLISAMGIVPDVERTMTMDLKHPGNLLYVVGETRDECGGSHYAMLNGATAAGRLPQPATMPLETLTAVHRAIRDDLAQAVHDCSEGGLGVTLAEMCLAGQLGAELDLTAVPGAADIQRDDAILYAESLTRFVVEVRPEDAGAFEAALAGVPHAQVGRVTETGALRVQGLDGQEVVRADVAELETAWRGASNAGDVEMVRQKGASAPTRSSNHDVRDAGSLHTHTTPPRVLILHAKGTNRDREVALACDLAGGAAEIVHINQLLCGERRLLDYHMFVLPGGFSYGDDLGAGALWALDLRHRLGDDLTAFVNSGRPVLGICNGFQTLVKSGVLPGADWRGTEARTVTLAANESGVFECRWVYLRPNVNSTCLFTRGVEELIYCPVAHAEGRLAVADEKTLAALQEHNLIALTYAAADGDDAAGYPANPNGSVLGIAGLTNPAGNVLGLMPHPEDHIFPWQHPRRHRDESGMLGLRLFENGLAHA